MDNLKVANVIISKQPKDSENFQEFLRIIKEKKINVRIVEAGNRINIEKDLYFDILWPNSNDFIEENALNNNSIVCKLVYKNFTMLLTGDIEEIGEEKLVKMYEESNVLESTILKIAHHGSKTSSTNKFLELIHPKIALIGVGASNTFGHPNEGVLDRLINSRC